MKRVVNGFTLIEMTMSMLIVSILLAALGSVLTVTLYTAGDAAAAATRNARTAELADQVTADLNVALNFTERTANAVTFTVPDRDGDAVPDQLRYAWGNNLLTRQYKTNPATTIAQDVRLFNLSYLTWTMNPPPPPPPETLICSFDSDPTATMQDFKIDGNNWVTQYFTPNLPPSAISWSISRIRLMASCDNSKNDGVTLLQVRAPLLNHAPTNIIFDQTTFYEVSLSTTYRWIDVPMNIQGLSPLSGVCIVMGKKAGSGALCLLQCQNSNKTLLPNAYYTDSSNGGTTWQTPTSTKAMRFYVYGYVQ